MTSNSCSDGGEGAGEETGELPGKRVLIVEDDPFLSLDLEEMIAEAGALVVGRAPSIEAALDLLDKIRPDAALLDLNLRGDRATPVALALKSAGIPFCLTSGYSRSQIDEPLLDDVPLVAKPVQPKLLIAALRKLLKD